MVFFRKAKTLKGQCHETFCFRFFPWITFPQAPENNIRVILNFFENSQVKVRPVWNLPPVAKLSAVSTTPAVNLPPVSTILAANFATSSTCVLDTGGKKWEQYQAADTLNWSWRQKHFMFTLLPNGVQTKLLKFFSFEIFSIYHRCQQHRWWTLSREYLRKFLEKF